MKNLEIADIFDQLAEVVEFQNPKNAFFRVRALRYGAQVLRNLPESIDNLSHKELTSIHGIGDKMADKIIEYCQTGKIKELEDEAKKLPPGIFDLLRVPSLGPKRVRLIHDTLGVSDLAELKASVESGKISELPGFGEKSAQKILRGIEIFSKVQEKRPLGEVYPIIENIIERLKSAKLEDQKSVFLVTWITHNSRVSERMVEFGIKKDKSVWLNQNAEIEITKIIKDIVIENDIKVLAYNICGDHVHMIMACENEEELAKIVKTIKGKSARLFNKNNNITSANKGFKPLVNEKKRYNKTITDSYTNEKMNITMKHFVHKGEDENYNKATNQNKHVNARTRGLTPLFTKVQNNRIERYADGTINHLWAQKFNTTFIVSDKQLSDAFEYVKNNRQKHNLPQNKTLEKIIESMISTYEEIFENQIPLVDKIEIAGSIRRGKDIVHDGDILATGKNPQKIIDLFCNLPDKRELIAQGDTKASILLKNGFQVDLRVVPKDVWGSALAYFTGSKNHNIIIRTRAQKMGLKVSEWGVFKGAEKIAGETEESLYKALKLPYIPPEIREGAGEIEAAEENKLPKLVEKNDIKGDLHVHSNFSDGESSIEEMVIKAIKLNYEYIAITDHSQSQHIGNGLNEKRLIEQKKEIDKIQKKYPKISIFWGTECDILPDGSLDYSDEILKKFDFVIASIHSKFNEDNTERMLKAINNPYVNAIGHPTTRLFGQREETILNFEKIFKVASNTGTALEINSYPYRLDLRSELCREAKNYGVKFIISTDAHSVDDFDNIHFGIKTAKRGWLEKKDILNSQSLKNIQDFVKQKRKA